MSNIDKTLKTAGWLFFGTAAIALAMFVLAFAVRWCWNEAMPHTFGLPEINYWQAFALGILAHIFFGCTGSSSK